MLLSFLETCAILGSGAGVKLIPELKNSNMTSLRVMCVGLACVDIVSVCKNYPEKDSDQR